MNKPTIQSLHTNHYHFDDSSIMLIIQQFDKTIKQWKFQSYRCKLCDSSFKTLMTASKHHTVCKQINTIKKREVFMPIQVVTKNGQRMYRYGDTGKLYADRKDAEKQAAAIQASGYKEPKKLMEKK
jgi:hypothetical protein